MESRTERTKQCMFDVGVKAVFYMPGKEAQYAQKGHVIHQDCDFYRWLFATLFWLQEPTALRYAHKARQYVMTSSPPSVPFGFPALCVIRCGIPTWPGSQRLLQISHSSWKPSFEVEDNIASNQVYHSFDLSHEELGIGLPASLLYNYGYLARKRSWTLRPPDDTDDGASPIQVLPDPQ